MHSTRCEFRIRLRRQRRPLHANTSFLTLYRCSAMSVTSRRAVALYMRVLPTTNLLSSCLPRSKRTGVVFRRRNLLAPRSTPLDRGPSLATVSRLSGPRAFGGRHPTAFCPRNDVLCSGGVFPRRLSWLCATKRLAKWLQRKPIVVARRPRVAAGEGVCVPAQPPGPSVGALPEFHGPGVHDL